MISVLQQFVKDLQIRIRDVDTIQEMLAFEQVRESVHGVALATPRYEGTKGSPDDRVMALAIAAGVVLTSPVYDFAEDMRAN